MLLSSRRNDQDLANIEQVFTGTQDTGRANHRQVCEGRRVRSNQSCKDQVTWNMEAKKKERPSLESHVGCPPAPEGNTLHPPRRRGSTGDQEIGAWSSKQSPAQGPGGERESPKILTTEVTGGRPERIRVQQMKKRLSDVSKRPPMPCIVGHGSSSLTNYQTNM